MSTAISDTEEFRAALESKLEQHASRSVSLLFVDDVSEWAKNKVVGAKGNPAAMAAKGPSGTWRIVMRRELTEERIRGVLDRLLFGGWLNAEERLKEPEKFLQHLALHELAHLQNSWGQDKEDQCDEWAFERL